MSDEMKLLMALCNALGFSVERVEHFDEERYNQSQENWDICLKLTDEMRIPLNYTPASVESCTETKFVLTRISNSA